jgi:hypothetical protein
VQEAENKQAKIYNLKKRIELMKKARADIQQVQEMIK